MPLRGPSMEDQRKLHAEINQISHQRFLISTTALTLFGLVIAWMLPKEPPAPSQGVGNFEYSMSALLSWLLFGLFILSHMLRRVLQVCSLYLIETGASRWEVDFAGFRRRAGYAGYTKPQAALFMVLNLLAVAFPFLLAVAYSEKIEFGSAMEISMALGVIPLVLTGFMGFGRLFEPDVKIAERWKALLRPGSN